MTTKINLVPGITRYRTHIDFGHSTTHAMKIKSTEDTVRNTKYQFDVYQGEEVEVFDFDPVDRNIELKYM